MLTFLARKSHHKCSTLFQKRLCCLKIEKKQISFYMILHNFSSNSINPIRETFIFYALLRYICFPFLCWIKFCNGCFRQLDRFFLFVRQKKWLLVTLDRWSSYTVMTVWVFALADSAFVILDEWSSYGGGRLGRFDCIFIGWQKSFTE